MPFPETQCQTLLSASHAVESTGSTVLARDVDLSLYRQRIKVIAGTHDGTVYAKPVPGRIVVIACVGSDRPYGVRLNGTVSWEIYWFARDAFEVLP